MQLNPSFAAVWVLITQAVVSQRSSRSSSIWRMKSSSVLFSSLCCRKAKLPNRQRCRIKRPSCRQSFQRPRCLESGRLSSSGHVAKMKKATLLERRPRCRTHGDRTKTRVFFFRCLHGHVANFGQVAINLRGQVAVIGSERTRRHSDRCQG